MTKDKAWEITVRRLKEIIERWDSWSDETLARRLAEMTMPKTFKLVHPKIMRTREWMALTKKMVARWPGVVKNRVERPPCLDEGKEWWRTRQAKKKRKVKA